MGPCSNNLQAICPNSPMSVCLSFSRPSDFGILPRCIHSLRQSRHCGMANFLNRPKIQSQRCGVRYRTVQENRSSASQIFSIFFLVIIDDFSPLSILPWLFSSQAHTHSRISSLLQRSFSASFPAVGLSGESCGMYVRYLT